MQDVNIESIINLAKTYAKENKLSHTTAGLGISVYKDLELSQSFYIGKTSLDNDGHSLSDKDLFHICSITKMLVGLLYLKMDQENKISLDAKLVDYYEDAPACLKDINLWQMLTHTSGLVDYLVHDQNTPDTTWKQKDKIYELIWSLNSVKSESNGNYLYSSSNYFLLGEIIEKITEHTWFELLDIEILKPLEMGATYDPSSFESIKKGFAYQHKCTIEDDKRAYHPLPHIPYYVGWADSGLISSVSDLSKLSKLFESDVFLKKEVLINSLKKRETICEDKTYCSWGVQIPNAGSGQWYMHGGANDGIQTLWMYNPHSKITIVSFANHLNWSGGEVHNSFNSELIKLLGIQFR